MINDKCKMINDKCSGFSLIEVLVAISLMALIAVYLGARAGDLDPEDKFYKTCYMMEEIKEAIIGRPGLYCNGIRQFTGYVSDMGNLPNLYYFDNQEKEFVQVTHAESGRIEADGLADALKQGHRPQPWALWRKTEGMPEWKYHEEKGQLWAGWSGPYIDPPAGGALRDAWGNQFLFVVGEVVGYEDNYIKKTYRCKKTYISEDGKDGRSFACGPESDCGESYWEMINEDEKMNFRTWIDVGTETWPQADPPLTPLQLEKLRTKQEKFYGPGCLTIISLGKNGKPGGDGLDKDIQIVIEPVEYMGEVAGHAGARGELFADRVCLYYPDYTEDGGGIKSLCIPESGKMEDNSYLFAEQDVKKVEKYKCTGGMYERCKESPDWDTANCSCRQYETAIIYHCWCKESCEYFYYDNWCCTNALNRDPCICRGNCNCADSGDPDACRQDNPDYSGQLPEDYPKPMPWEPPWEPPDDVRKCIAPHPNYPGNPPQDICIDAYCREDMSGAAACGGECMYCCNDNIECAEQPPIRYCDEWRCDYDIGDGVDGCDCSPDYVEEDLDDCYSGINFSFGATPACKTTKEDKWSCVGGGYVRGNLPSGCTCGEYECLEYYCGCPEYCHENYPQFVCWSELLTCQNQSHLETGQNPFDHPDCTCDEWGDGEYSNLCVGAACIKRKVTCWGGCSGHVITCSCDKYGGTCLELICDDYIEGRECVRTTINSEIEYEDPNRVEMNIPTGIRSIKADKNYYMFSVCPGGNWIGTVRGD